MSTRASQCDNCKEALVVCKCNAEPTLCSNCGDQLKEKHVSQSGEWLCKPCLDTENEQMDETDALHLGRT